MNGQGREKEGRGAPAPHGASEMTHHHYCYSPPQTQQCYTFDAFINLHSKNHCEQYDHWFTDAWCWNSFYWEMLVSRQWRHWPVCNKRIQNMENFVNVSTKKRQWCPPRTQSHIHSWWHPAVNGTFLTISHTLPHVQRDYNNVTCK